jgi:hypothetical protein
VKVPAIRQVAKEFSSLPLPEVERLLHSEIHEERLLALVILVSQFEKGDDATKKSSNRLPRGIGWPLESRHEAHTWARGSGWSRQGRLSRSAA